MALKKSNLSPEVKARLRQAVLGEINQPQPKTKSAAVSVAKLKTEKPPLKTLNKIAPSFKPAKPVMVQKAEIKTITPKPVVAEKPVASKPAVIVKPTKPKAKAKATAKVKKTPLRPKNKKPVSIAETISEPAPTPVKPAISKSIYGKPKSVVTRDWERPAAKEESLESLFKTPKSTLAKTSGFFKKPISNSAPAPTAKASKVTLPFLKKDKEATVKKAKSGSWLKLFGLLVLILVLLLGFDILGIYQLGFRDDLSYQVARNLQLPVGSVNGSSLALTSYLSDLQLLNLPLSQKREGLIDYSTKPDIKDKIFYRLAALEIMSNKLAGYQKGVSAQDVDNQMKLLLQQTGGRDQAEKIVKSIYGLNLVQFRDKVIKPMLLRENLQQAIMNDDALDINKVAKSRAEEVLKLVRASSSDFQALAKQYTDDEASINTGGDLGWVVKGQLDPQWESLIFNASSSTVIPQLVKSNFGYHIIKVEQKLIDPNTNTESVKLRHILIKVDIDKYIKELLDSAKLVRYVK